MSSVLSSAFLRSCCSTSFLRIFTSCPSNASAVDERRFDLGAAASSFAAAAFFPLASLPARPRPLSLPAQHTQRAHASM
jgi:hypothetical protein